MEIKQRVSSISFQHFMLKLKLFITENSYLNLTNCIIQLSAVIKLYYLNLFSQPRGPTVYNIMLYMIFQYCFSFITWFEFRQFEYKVLKSANRQKDTGNHLKRILSVIKWKRYKNKDDNIHYSEALKWKDKRTLTLVDFQN